MSRTTTQTQTLNPPPPIPTQILATTTTTTTAAAAAATSPPPSAPVPLLANFNYYLPPPSGPPGSAADSKPSTDDLELILGSKNQDTRRLPVHDLRGRFDSFELDECGFHVVELDSTQILSDAAEGWADDDWIRSAYYPVIERVVRRLYPELSEILHLGHILRGALPRTDFTGPTDPAWNRPSRACAPATRAHVDFTHRGVRLVLAQEFDEQTAERVCDSGSRFVALSLWKPLKTVNRDPLGFCDGRTVDREDLVVLGRVYPDGKEGENVVVKARRQEDGRGVHDWYWISNQDPRELVALKLFDSEEVEGRCTQTPHASFTLEGSDGVPGVRESVEVRVVACF